MSRPAIFLDRDGVLNENRDDHVKSWAEFQFLPGVGRALTSLARLQAPIVVVTNQAIINRRVATADAVEDIHRRMLRHIRDAGARVDGVLCCPHEASDNCACRKPAPGLLLAAAQRYDIDLRRSVFIGDAASDVLAGKRVGCRTILVLTGRGRDTLSALATLPRAIPDAVAPDLYAATSLIARLIGHRARREVALHGAGHPPARAAELNALVPAFHELSYVG